MAHLVLKLLALWSFTGGPLWLADELKPRFGTPISFSIAFAPIALMLFGSLVFEDEPTSLTRAVVLAGAGGAFALLGMDALAGQHLLFGGTHSEPTLIVFGCIVGVVAAIAYLAAAVRYLHREAP